MNKKEMDTVDEFIKQAAKLPGDLIKNPETGAHDVWIKKSDLLDKLNEMIKALKELQ